MPTNDAVKTLRTKRIGLAVSGGADSVALLVLLAGLQAAHGFEAVVLHVDHGLREDSAADARFVRKLAAGHALPFHMTRANIVRAQGESVEMAARRVRLEFFEKMTKSLKLDAIATGHHADDVAETFILRLARGSGAEGLAGLKRISHVGGITFIRPLLDLRTSELRAFLQSRGIPWREDYTNADVSIPRNNVRHRVLPWLRENLDEHIVEHLCKSAAILRGELQKKPSAEKSPADVSAADVSAPNFTLTVKPVTGYVRRVPGGIGVLPAVCELSRAALAGRTLQLRPWCPGDRIAPTGMGGRTRKLQDVYVTAKVSPAIRQTLPVLADAKNGEILWIPGYRVAESVAVESPTASAWQLTLQKV